MSSNSVIVLKRTLCQSQVNLSIGQSTGHLSEQGFCNQYPTARGHVVWHIKNLDFRTHTCDRHDLPEIDVRVRGRDRSPRTAGLRLVDLFNPCVITIGPRDCCPWIFPIAQELFQIESSYLSYKSFQIFCPLFHQSITLRRIPGCPVAKSCCSP